MNSDVLICEWCGYRSSQSENFDQCFDQETLDELICNACWSDYENARLEKLPQGEHA